MTSTHTVLLLIALLPAIVACGRAATTAASTPPAASDLPSDVRSDIILATTTSTRDSGLLDVLLPPFEQATGYEVKIIAVGTGQALKMGEEGNADILMVHAPAAEQAFMETGSGTDRRLLMHNQFVIVGPSSDPAGVKNTTSATQALQRIASAQAVFVSRGDNSGTNKREILLWEETGISPSGPWYLESGQGMGATLRIASERDGYTITDQATYLSLRSSFHLDVAFLGDPQLLNVYHSILVNPDRWPDVNHVGATALADYLVSEQGQQIIGQFGLEQFGQPLFTPDTGKDESVFPLE